MAVSSDEPPAALVSHCVVVGVDTESLPAPETPAEASETPHDILSADVLHSFPLGAIETPTGAVPPLPDSVALFCLPAGVIAKRTGDKDADKIKFFSFVLTNMDGSRSFGTCVSWYEPLETYPGTLVPKVLCLMSSVPYFSLFRCVLALFLRRYGCGIHPIDELLRRTGQRLSRPSIAGEVVASEATRPQLIPQQQWLSALSKGEVVQELLLTTFLMFTRVPPPGIRLNLDFGGHHIDFFRPSMTAALPTVDSDCFKHLFRSLSVSNIVFIMSALLQEQRVLLHSTNMERLCGVCEALVSLLFPLVWAHALVPVLPLQMLQFLQAPCPYVMGLHTDFLETQEGMDALVTSVIVHLDVDKVVTPMEIELPGGLQVDVVPELPSVLRTRLLAEVAAAIPPRDALVTAAVAVEAQHLVLGAPLRDATVTPEDLLHVSPAVLMPQDTGAVSSYSSNLRLQRKQPPPPLLYLDRFLPQPDQARLRVDTNAAVEEMLADDFGASTSNPTDGTASAPVKGDAMGPPPSKSAVPPLVTRFDEPWVVQVRAAFASVMGTMLAGYRSYLVVTADLPEEIIAALPPALIDAPRRFRWAGEPTVNAAAAQPMGQDVSGLGISRDKRQAELVAQSTGSGSIMTKMKTMFTWGSKSKSNDDSSKESAQQPPQAPSTPSSTTASGFSLGWGGRSSVGSPSGATGGGSPNRDNARNVLSEAQAEAEHAAARNAATVKWLKGRAGGVWMLPDDPPASAPPLAEDDALFVAALTDADLPVTIFGQTPAQFLTAKAVTGDTTSESAPEVDAATSDAQSDSSPPGVPEKAPTGLPAVAPPITFRVEFHKTAFLQSRPAAWRGFMETMLNTQAVSSFLEDAALTGRLLEAAQVATAASCIAGGATVQVPIEGAFPMAHVTAAVARNAPLHLVTAAPFVKEAITKTPLKQRPPSESNVSVSSDSAPAPLLRGFRPFGGGGAPKPASSAAVDSPSSVLGASDGAHPPAPSPKPQAAPVSGAFDGVSGSVARTAGHSVVSPLGQDKPEGSSFSSSAQSSEGTEWAALWACLSDAEVVQDTVLCHLPPLPLPPPLRSSWWEDEFKHAREAALQAADSGAKATASSASDSVQKAAAQAQLAERDEEAILRRQQEQYDALGVSAEDAAEIRLFDWLCAVQVIHSGASAGFLPKWPGMHAVDLVPRSDEAAGSDSASDSSDTDEDSEASSSDDDADTASASTGAACRPGVTFAAAAATASEGDASSAQHDGDNALRSDSGMDASVGADDAADGDLYARRRGASLSRRAAFKAQRSGTVSMKEFFNSPREKHADDSPTDKRRSVSLSFKGKQPAPPSRPSPPSSPLSRPGAPVLLPADVLETSSALLTRKPVQLASMGDLSPANSVANLLLCGRQDCVPSGHKAPAGMPLGTAQERVLDIEEAAADLYSLWREPMEQMLAQHDALHGGENVTVEPQKDHINLPPLRYGLLSAMQVLAVTTDMSAPQSSASSVSAGADQPEPEADASDAPADKQPADDSEDKLASTSKPRTVNTRGALHRASMTWAHGSPAGLALTRAATDGVLQGRFADGPIPPPGDEGGLALDAVMAAEAARSRSQRSRMESSASTDTASAGGSLFGGSSGRTPRAQGSVVGLGTARRMRMRRSSMALELNDIGLLVSKPDGGAAVRQRGQSHDSQSTSHTDEGGQLSSPSMSSSNTGDAADSLGHLPILQRRGTAGRRNRRLGSIAVTGLAGEHLAGIARSDSMMSSTDWTRHSTSSSYITPAVATEAAARAAALTAQLSGQSYTPVEETGSDSDSTTADSRTHSRTGSVQAAAGAGAGAGALHRGSSMRLRGRRGSISVMSHAMLMAAHKPADSASPTAAAARARHKHSLSSPTGRTAGPISPLRETSADDSDEGPRHFSASDSDSDNSASPEQGRMSPQGVAADETTAPLRVPAGAADSTVMDAEAARGDLDSPRFSTWSVASSVSYAPPGIAGRDSLDPSDMDEPSQEALESTLLVKNLDTGELAHVGAVLTPVERSLAAIKERSASVSPTQPQQGAAAAGDSGSPGGGGKAGWWSKVTSRVASLTKPKASSTTEAQPAGGATSSHSETVPTSMEQGGAIDSTVLEQSNATHVVDDAAAGDEHGEEQRPA